MPDGTWFCIVVQYMHSRPGLMARSLCMRHKFRGPLDLTSIVHFSYIHQLLTPGTGDIFGIFLGEKGLISCLDRVHGVASAGYSGGKVVDASAVGHLPDQFLAAKTKAYDLLA